MFVEKITVKHWSPRTGWSYEEDFANNLVSGEDYDDFCRSYDWHWLYYESDLEAARSLLESGDDELWTTRLYDRDSDGELRYTGIEWSTWLSDVFAEIAD